MTSRWNPRSPDPRSRFSRYHGSHSAACRYVSVFPVMTHKSWSPPGLTWKFDVYSDQTFMSQSLSSCMATRTSCVMWWLCKKMHWYMVRIKQAKTCYIAWTSCSQRQGSTVPKASIQGQKNLKEPTRHVTSTMNINCLDITMQCEIWLWVSRLNFSCGRRVSWLSISPSTTFNAICVFPW